MANRLFSTHSQRLTKLSRNFLVLTQEMSRNYSNQGWRRKNTYVEQVLFGHAERQANTTIWPDPNLGCLGAKDKRFNLPGNVGLDQSVLETEKPPTPDEIKADKKVIEDEIAFWRDLVDSPTGYQRQVSTLNHHQQVEKILDEEIAASEQALQREKLDLECVPQSCPDLLRRELAGLFGSVNLTTGPLTVITFCHRTKNDMSCRSPDVENERDIVVNFFVSAAKELCTQIRNRAQWADFIVPKSGRPFYAKYNNLNFFETDERYKMLGFRVVDLGCTKVITHHKWGSHAFVGSVFTTAPHDSDYLEQILESFKGRTK